MKLASGNCSQMLKTKIKSICTYIYHNKEFKKLNDKRISQKKTSFKNQLKLKHISPLKLIKAYMKLFNIWSSVSNGKILMAKELCPQELKLVRGCPQRLWEPIQWGVPSSCVTVSINIIEVVTMQWGVTKKFSRDILFVDIMSHNHTNVSIYSYSYITVSI